MVTLTFCEPKITSQSESEDDGEGLISLRREESKIVI